MLERGESRRGEVARCAGPQLRGELLKQRDVVGVPKPWRCDQNGDPGEVERIFDLAESVGGIEADEDAAAPRRGVLRDQPLSRVRAPEGDTVPFLQAERKEAAGEQPHRCVERPVGVAGALVPAHQRLTLAVLGDGSVEKATDRFALQGLARRATQIRTVQTRAV